MGVKISFMEETFIDRDCFRIWTKSYYPIPIKPIGTILSLYSPYFIEDGERYNNGPYTAATTFGIFKFRDKVNLILFSLFPRSIINPNELIIHAKNLCTDYMNNSTVKTYSGPSPDLMIVPSEYKERNNLFNEIQENKVDVPVRRFYYSDYGKILDNMLTRALPKIIEGRIWVASKPDNKLELRNMDEKFLDMMSSYPSIESKATVWTLVQAILYLESQGLFRDEGEWVDGTNKPKHGFYDAGT